MRRSHEESYRAVKDGFVLSEYDARNLRGCAQDKVSQTDAGESLFGSYGPLLLG